MLGILSSLLLLIALSGELTSSDPQAAANTLGQIECSKSNGKVIVDFGITRHPTHFGIETPEGFRYIRYSPRGVDVLGDRYKKEILELPLQTATGVMFVDQQPVSARIFSKPGKYTLRFKDANWVAADGAFTLSCDLAIDADDLAAGKIPPSKIPSAQNSALSSITPIIATKASTCGYHPGCPYCCESGINPSFCTCSICCVAEPPPSSDLRVATAGDGRCPILPYGSQLSPG